MKVLAIDVGGTHVKILVPGALEKRAMVSGPKLTAQEMVVGIKKLAKGWDYDAVSIGYPGPVKHHRPLADPVNLGTGWVDLDYDKAFGRPVRMLNDAAMQALGSYHGGRMLFLGLGTGLGSAMVLEGIVEPMELAHLPYKKGREFEYYVGLRGLRRLGKAKWRKEVDEVIERLRAALQPDYVVVGGGNAKKLKKLPDATELGDNGNAFIGGFRLWHEPGSARKLRRVAG